MLNVECWMLNGENDPMERSPLPGGTCHPERSRRVRSGYLINFLNENKRNTNL